MRWSSNASVKQVAIGTRAIERPELNVRVNRILMLGAFAIALLAFIAAPLLAVQWSNKPFPGFLIEETVVVDPIPAINQGWSGAKEGIHWPQHVTRVAGQAVVDSETYQAVINAHEIGDRIPVFTRLQDGSEQLYPNIVLTAFPMVDMFRLFWLPYLVGAVYLGIGAWIYRLRGQTRSGRALALFCIVTALVTALIFDSYTTHRLLPIWIVAVALIGGVLIGLVLRFPEEWSFSVKRPWVTWLPLLLSILLAIMALMTQYFGEDAWTFLVGRRASYRYAAFGIIAYFAVIVYRAFRGTTPLVRRQARMVMIGAVLAFSPIMLWLIAPIFGFYSNFDPAVFLPPLLIFPVAFVLAILRYRLWDVDSLVNRAFVYGLVTAILAGAFAALIGFTQRLFLAITGEQSDLAIVITTLIVASVFTPVKARVEAFVARLFRDGHENVRELRAYGEQVRAFVQMSDVNQISQRLLAEAVRTFGAESGALSVMLDGRAPVIHTTGVWRNNAHLSVSLNCGEHRHGILQLGPPLPDHQYDRQDAEALQEVADQVASAICLAAAHYRPRGVEEG